MIDIDELLRDFRADVPGPADGAPERILERARHAPQPRMSAPPHVARPRRSKRLRWAVPLAVAAAVTAVVAIGPTIDLTNNATGITLLERAEAALTPTDRIQVVTIRFRTASSEPNGSINPNRVFTMRQWTLAGTGRAIQMRRLITEGPLNRPPTDEDGTLLTDRSGRVIDERSWTPLLVHVRDNYNYPRGGGRGELTLEPSGGPLPSGTMDPTFTPELLRYAYKHHLLRPAGRTETGDLRLRGGSLGGVAVIGSGACPQIEVILDPNTFAPRRVTLTNHPAPCRPGAPITESETTSITLEQTLPATAANRRLLAIGDWPTVRTLDERDGGKPRRIHRVPPVPPLDEG